MKRNIFSLWPQNSTSRRRPSVKITNPSPTTVYQVPIWACARCFIPRRNPSCNFRAITPSPFIPAWPHYWLGANGLWWVTLIFWCVRALFLHLGTGVCVSWFSFVAPTRNWDTWLRRFNPCWQVLAHKKPGIFLARVTHVDFLYLLAMRSVCSVWWRGCLTSCLWMLVVDF